MLTPSSASTSAEPLRLVMLRLPCLATGTPAAAATIAAVVLTLNIFEPPPPVPQVSSTSAWRLRMGVMWRRMASGGAGDFVDRFALGGQRREQQADLIVGPLAAHDGIDGAGHLVEREVAAAGDAAQNGGDVVRHDANCSRHDSVCRSRG